MVYPSESMNRIERNVCAIDTEILSQVLTIIQNPLRQDKYVLLKNRSVELYTDR